jgi:hypothetical protein
MKKYILIFSLALLLSSCDFTWGNTSPEKEANAYATRTQADISEAAAIQNRRQDEHLFALDYAVANEAKAEQIRAQKVSIYANEYAKTAAKVIGVFSLAGLAISLVIATGGASWAFVKKAQTWSSLIHANPRTRLFPIQQYTIEATGGKMVFAIHHGTGAVYRLDVSKAGDRQMITGLLALQQTGIQAAEAVRGRNLKAGAGGFGGAASIQPELITAKTMTGELVDDVENLLEEGRS